MAQIPTGNFGQAVADPARTIGVPRMDVSSGITNFANQAAAEAQGILDQQTRAKTALALATANNAARQAHDDVAQGLLSGQVDPKDAQTKLQDHLGAIEATNTQDLPADQAAMVRAQFSNTAGEVSRQLNGTVFKYNESRTLATIHATGEQLQQDAPRRGPAAVADTYDAVMTFTGGSAGLSPEQQTVMKQAFRQNTTHGYYDNKASDLYAARDQHGLAGVLETLSSGNLPKGEQLSQEQRAHLTTRVIGLNSRLLSDQRAYEEATKRDQLARENAATDAFNEAQKIVLNGQFLDQPTMDKVAALSTGTQLQQRAQALLAEQPHTVAFASASAVQRAAILEHYRAEAANPAVGTSPDGQKQFAALQAIDSKANELAKDNPWKAAQTYGVIINARPMDMTHPDNALPLLDLRNQQIGKVEVWVGHKVSPLQPAEAAQLVQALRGMPPEQTASALSLVGGMVGDSDRIAAVAKQLGDKDGIYRLGMAFAGDRTESGKLTAEHILRGAQALRDKTSLVDTTAQTGWRASIAGAVRGAFSSQQAEDDAIQAAFLITVARDSSGESSGDWQGAVKMATGGIITHGLGKIPLPMNMDESTFDKKVSAITPADLAAQMPAAQGEPAGIGSAYGDGHPIAADAFVASLPKATFVHAGQGMYVVKAGNDFVTNALGQRIVLRISQ